MSDDRISQSPDPPRCPVCATGFTATPGASCPACGRVLAPPNPIRVPDFGRKRSYGLPFLYESPRVQWSGILFLLLIGFYALQAPGILIPGVILLLPALVRTIRLALLIEAHESTSTRNIILALLASIGVAVICGIASGIAFCIVCGIITGGNLYAPVGPGMIAGWVVAFIVFVVVFLYYWPRSGSGSMPAPPDPEN